MIPAVRTDRPIADFELVSGMRAPRTRSGCAILYALRDDDVACLEPGDQLLAIRRGAGGFTLVTVERVRDGVVEGDLPGVPGMFIPIAECVALGESRAWPHNAESLLYFREMNDKVVGMP